MRGKQKLSGRLAGASNKKKQPEQGGPGENESRNNQAKIRTNRNIFPCETGIQGSMEPDPATPPAGGAAASVPPPPPSSLIFLGTGCSGALPDTRCLIRPGTPPCHVCSMGLSLPPDQNPNYRCERQRILASIDMELVHLATEFIFTQYK